GPGMLAQLNCQSLEKLVIDNELCGAAYRFSRGIDFEDFGVVTELIAKVGSSGDFLRQKHTSKNLRSEHLMPTDVIDRLTSDSWVQGGSRSTDERANERVTKILQDSSFEVPDYLRELDGAFEQLKKNYET
ncbi:MAG: trimethylamine methyltransferase family protein, partial [Promethearchaeota archaeon]